MLDALILAKNNGFDVFNALDIMDNKSFFTVFIVIEGLGAVISRRGWKLTLLFVQLETLWLNRHN
jgi:glycylpeptide N-tetradecanoyltransferase